MDLQFFGSILTSTTPILFAALGALVCFRSGFFNIAIEGQMLVAAFAAAAVAVTTGNAALSVLAGVLASTALGVLVTVATYWARIDAIVVGVAANLMAAGVTALMVREITGGSSSLVIEAGRLPRVDAAAAADWGPLAGLVRGQTPLVPAALVSIVVVWWILNRTRTGLGIRALGESELAVWSSGMSIPGIRAATTLICGVLCGLSGAQLALGPATSFSVGMTNGRGFTAMIAAMIGAGVVATALGCVLFGLVDAVGLRIQLADTGMPQAAVQAIPYVLALIVLCTASALRLRGTDRVRRAVLRH